MAMELDLTGDHPDRDAELMSTVTDMLPASFTTLEPGSRP